MGDPDRFNPLFWFIVQFIPENFILWHLIVVFVFFLTSLLIFSISKKITKNNNISILTSVLLVLILVFLLKPYLGIYFDIYLMAFVISINFNIPKFYQKNSNKNAYLIFYIITLSLGIFIMETGSFTHYLP